MRPRKNRSCVTISNWLQWRTSTTYHRTILDRRSRHRDASMRLLEQLPGSHVRLVGVAKLGRLVHGSDRPLPLLKDGRIGRCPLGTAVVHLGRNGRLRVRPDVVVHAVRFQSLCELELEKFDATEHGARLTAVEARTMRRHFGRPPRSSLTCFQNNARVSALYPCVYGITSNPPYCRNRWSSRIHCVWRGTGTMMRCGLSGRFLLGVLHFIPAALRQCDASWKNKKDVQ